MASLPRYKNKDRRKQPSGPAPIKHVVPAPDLQNRHRKRLIAFGGIFKEIRKELFLDDVEEGDLIKVSDDEDKESSTGKELIAVWNWERKNYFVR